MSAGTLAPEGGLTIPNSSAGSESGTSSTASYIAKTAGKWLVKIGKGGNIVLMALTSDSGGEIVVVGTLETVEKNKQSWTGRFLKPVLV